MYYAVMQPEDVDGMVNSVDHYLTAFGSRLALVCIVFCDYLSQYLCSFTVCANFDLKESSQSTCAQTDEYL